MGNYFGTCGQSCFAGIRTPWTLEDPEDLASDSWRCCGGRLMFFGALLLLVLPILPCAPRAFVTDLDRFPILLACSVETHRIRGIIPEARREKGRASLA